MKNKRGSIFSLLVFLMLLIILFTFITISYNNYSDEVKEQCEKIGGVFEKSLNNLCYKEINGSWVEVRTIKSDNQTIFIEQ